MPVLLPTLGCPLGILTPSLSLCPGEPQSCWPALPEPLNSPSWAGGRGVETPLLAPQHSGMRRNQEEESIKNNEAGRGGA